MDIKEALKQLLDNLDKVEGKYSELYDTAVREELHEVIMEFFIFGSTDAEIPADGDYAMFSDEGNKAVHQAVRTFLTHPQIRAALDESPPPIERLDAFQDDAVQSANGSDYEDYFGWLDELPPR